MLARPPYYAATTVTTSNDPRDQIAEKIQLLVDATTDDAWLRSRLEQEWFSNGETELPGGWPPPSVTSRYAARLLVPHAACAALDAFRAIKLRWLELSVSSLSQVMPRETPA